MSGNAESLLVGFLCGVAVTLAAFSLIFGRGH